MKTFALKFFGSALLAFLVFGCNTETSVVSPENETSLLKSEQTELYSPGTGLFDLSQEERDGLIHMRIEEKLARDVYTVLGNTWNARVFLNIKLSEQAHMDAVKKMLAKYSIPDPIISNEVGVFPDPNFQTLYNQLVAQGSTSLQEAFLVGVAIEELDINDLVYQLTNVVDNPDIIKVYTNLKAGSVNHLAAFNRNLVSCQIQEVTE